MTASTPGFALIKPGQTYLSKHGVTYSAGASKETVGAVEIHERATRSARRLCMPIAV